MNNEYQDPVKKIVNDRINYSLNLKDNIDLICGTDISDTRLYQSINYNFTPTYRIEDNVLLLPYKDNHHIPKNNIFEHWAYDKNLNPIIIADHYKPVLTGYSDHHQLPKYPFKIGMPQEKLVGNYYYMGLLNPHYGHFIQESITRFWLSLKRPDLIPNECKFIYHVFSNFNDELKNKFFNSNLIEFLSALGIKKESIIFIKKPTIIENLIIPEAAISISDGNCYVSQECRNVWLEVNKKMSGYYNINEIKPTKKIYLSRKKVKNPIQGRVLKNELEIEALFSSFGFDIICPETLSQHEMQTILSETSFIASSPGSGLQNAFFIPHSAKTLGLTCLPIMKINPGLNHQINTDLVCDHQTFAYCSPEEYINNSGTSIEWEIPVTIFEKQLRKIL